MSRDVPKRKPGRKSSKKVESNGKDRKEEEEGLVRCVCERNQDNGLMIQCETCLVWQHGLCIGIREEKLVPPYYFCEVCLPRRFQCSCGSTNPTGKMIECTQCKTWRHIKCLGRSIKTLPKNYKCPACAPEAFISTWRKPGKRAKPKTFEFVKSPELRQQLEEDALKIEQASGDLLPQSISAPAKQKLIEEHCLRICDIPPEKIDEIILEDLLRGLSRVLESSTDTVKDCLDDYLTEMANGVEDEEIEDPYEGWTQLDENIYSRKAEKIENPNMEISENMKLNFSTCPGVQLGKLEKKLGILTKQNCEGNELITEFKASVVTTSEIDITRVPFRERDQLIARPESQLVFDARRFGNLSRFLRRSCTPNANVREISFDGRVHLGIFSLKTISDEAEVTVGLEENWRQSRHIPDCACGTSCVVKAWLLRRKQHARKFSEQLSNIDITDSSDSEVENQVEGQVENQVEKAAEPNEYLKCPNEH
eukprot:TRINITY_DN1757_c0_g1_i1.p1 TRINITY_DN1757_c0_g1~~TRINITY_DN1757_c0_g1_i1.p1  ORF type:complete len:480 (+),score=99.97 TRINITY_DN1757_c0_g1_i1:145-1584(+)